MIFAPDARAARPTERRGLSVVFWWGSGTVEGFTRAVEAHRGKSPRREFSAILLAEGSAAKRRGAQAPGASIAAPVEGASPQGEEVRDAGGRAVPAERAARPTV